MNLAFWLSPGGDMLKSRIKVWLFCCLLTASISEARSQAQTKDVREGTAEVSGRVTLKGEPVRGVSVVLQPYRQIGAAAQSPAARSKTDARGSFRITGVPAGRYLISAMAPGFISSGDASSGG